MPRLSTKNKCPHCEGMKCWYAKTCRTCRDKIRIGWNGPKWSQKLGPISLTKHGHNNASGKSPTYRSWNAMIQRCRNENSKEYYNYGGRGIKVCERWFKFEHFLADMGERPTGLGRGFTLDRYPNQNGNYEPGNCRWATWTEQMNNSRRNIRVEFQGQNLTLGEWARELNVDYKSLQRQHSAGKWPT